jgi:hypothetical protein
VIFLGAREIPPLNLDLLALTFLSFGYSQDKLCSPSNGTPLLRQITLMDNGVLEKLKKPMKSRKLPLQFCLTSPGRCDTYKNLKRWNE